MKATVYKGYDKATMYLAEDGTWKEQPEYRWRELDGTPFPQRLDPTEEAVRGHMDEDPLGAFRGMWFGFRLMLAVTMFAILCIDIAKHYNAGTWEAAFIQAVCGVAFTYALNTIPRWKDAWPLCAILFGSVGFFYWFAA